MSIAVKRGLLSLFAARPRARVAAGRSQRSVSRRRGAARRIRHGRQSARRRCRSGRAIATPRRKSSSSLPTPRTVELETSRPAARVDRRASRPGGAAVDSWSWSRSHVFVARAQSGARDQQPTALSLRGESDEDRRACRHRRCRCAASAPQQLRLRPVASRDRAASIDAARRFRSVPDVRRTVRHYAGRQPDQLEACLTRTPGRGTTAPNYRASIAKLLEIGSPMDVRSTLRRIALGASSKLRVVRTTTYRMLDDPGTRERSELLDISARPC